MKNYVVWTNCVITGTRDREFGIRPANTAHYNQMFEISQASARHFLAGTWEPVVFDQPAESRIQMFQQNWQRIWDLAHSEPCNILYLDSDTVFVQPTEIFGRWSEFRLFNWTFPNRTQEFDNYFNAGVRYYPHTMSAEVWQLGADLAANWNLDIWDQEQIIFNHMFWHQQLAWSDAHQPGINWQWPSNWDLHSAQQHNRLPREQAHIVHYHGTRDSNHAVKMARDMAQAAGVTL